MNVLRIDIDFFLFKMFFEELSKLFSSDLSLIISLKNRVVTTDEVVDKKEKSFDVDILLLLFSYYLKTTLYLFIYNFSKIKSYCFN